MARKIYGTPLDGSPAAPPPPIKKIDSRRLTFARNYIVSQRINVGVAMPYRAGRVIGKFGTVKRNRGPNVMFCTALDSWRVEFTARHRAVSAIATTNAVRYVKKLRPSPAFCADVCRVCVSTSTWRTFRRACAMGLEGIVSKRKDSRYRSGRSSDWLKMKNPACAAVTREAEEDWS